MRIQKPTPDQIRAARKAAGLTQKQAAELVHAGHVVNWNTWEKGRFGMPRAAWHLFLILTDQTDKLEKTA